MQPSPSMGMLGDPPKRSLDDIVNKRQRGRLADPGERSASRGEKNSTEPRKYLDVEKKLNNLQRLPDESRGYSSLGGNPKPEPSKTSMGDANDKKVSLATRKRREQ